MAIILIGVAAAVTFSLAQSNDEQLEEYEGTDQEFLSFDHIDHITHDIELPDTMTFCGEEVPLSRSSTRCCKLYGREARN